MTAEIAIMNAAGVALAADSAITFAGQKVYNGGNKLFSLSDTKPRAAMVYGNALVNGVPWETVLKKYRAERGASRCSSVEDVGRDLLAYLATFPFPQACTENYFSTFMKSELIGPIRQEVDEAVRQKTAGGGKISRDQIRRIVATAVGKAARAGKAEALLPDLDEADVECFGKTFASAIDGSVDEVFAGLPLPAKARDTLCRLSARWCLLAGDSDHMDSGLVVAGFGDSDIFPSVSEYVVRGVANGKALFREKAHYAVDGHCIAAVLPFAQKEEVHTFMAGIDPAYQQLIEGYVSFALDAFVSEVDTELVGLEPGEKRRVMRHLKRLVADLTASGGEVLAEYQRERKWGPIVSAVAALPKEEMAAMAESLVNLTSLKRRVSMDMETVGGPIDVAVLSLAEGLVWIKRKQYFPSELNRQLFACQYQ